MSAAPFVAHADGDTRFRYPEGQHFECRDCAARCCTMPWRVVITPEERERFEAQAWIRERFEKQGVAFEPMESGASSMPLVVRESDRRLVCAFLDDDELCSQLKHHERDFWSRTCQTFPYEFIEDEQGEVRVALSQHCPSIRDNYGQPLAPQLGKYLAASGSTKKLARVQTVGTGTKLTSPQWLRVLGEWEQIFADEAAHPKTRDALMRCFQLTMTLANDSVGKDAMSDRELEQGVVAGRKAAREGPPPEPSSSGQTLPRLLLALSLTRLTLPLRLINKSRFSLYNAWYSYRNLNRIWREKGEIDLLQMPRPLDLDAVQKIPPVPENGVLESRVRRYYRTVLAQRNLFCQEERSLHDILLDFALAYAVMLRVTRYRAWAYGRETAAEEDLGEGIAFAECYFLFHYSRTPPPALLKLMMATLSTNEPAFRGLLSVEG